MGNVVLQYFLQKPLLIIMPSSVFSIRGKAILSSHQWSKVTAGGNVTLQCQKPDNMTEYRMFHATEGRNSNTCPDSEIRKQQGRLLTSRYTGNYSCVYHQIGAPFWASHPSDHLEIVVSVSPSALSECYTKMNLIRLGMSAMFVILMAVFLAEAWYRLCVGQTDIPNNEPPDTMREGYTTPGTMTERYIVGNLVRPSEPYSPLQPPPPSWTNEPMIP
ncbi:hypothetical protein A6R68_17599, partial [Neotoma lepida]